MEESTLRLILLVVGIIIIVSIYLFDKFKKRPARRVNPAPDFLTEAAEKSRYQPRRRIEPELDDSFSDMEPMSTQSEALDPEVLGSMLEDQYDPIELNRNNNLKSNSNLKYEADAGSQSEPSVEPFSERTAETECETSTEPEPSNRDATNLILLLNVTALSSDGFAGPDLVKALTKLGLEYGEMGIFHYYERDEKQEQVWFHLVNMVEPGTFPIGSMQNFETPGVSLFFQSVEVEDPCQVFEHMLNTAERLADVLSGQVLNQQREPITRQDLDLIDQQLQGVSGSLP